MGLSVLDFRNRRLEHRRHNTPAIKLSDMEKRDIIGIYYISVDAAHNLVNERIK